MTSDFRLWFCKLQNHAENCRSAKPIPGPETLSRSAAQQFLIIKGSLLNQLHKLPPAIVSLDDQQKDHWPCIIFTSNTAGLAAAKEIARAADRILVALYPAELRNFLLHCPDTDHKYHVHIWSHFIEDLNSQSAWLAERYPLTGSEKLWLHVEGVAAGRKLSKGAEHLWSWDGVQLKLLQKSFRLWAS